MCLKAASWRRRLVPHRCPPSMCSPQPERRFSAASTPLHSLTLTASAPRCSMRQRVIRQRERARADRPILRTGRRLHPAALHAALWRHPRPAASGRAPRRGERPRIAALPSRSRCLAAFARMQTRIGACTPGLAHTAELVQLRLRGILARRARDSGAVISGKRCIR